MKFCLVVIFSVLLIPSFIAAQEKKKLSLSVLAGPFISNDGINAFVEVEATLGKHSVYFGPSFSQTNSSRINDSYRGLKGGYNQKITEGKNVCSFIGLDYQHYLLNTIVKAAYGDFGRNFHHEWNLYYGFEKKLLKNTNLWFGSNIGFGFYIENYHFHKTDGDFRLSGYSRFVDLYLHYKI